jgi:methionyl-tRNA formyltransferase
MKILFIGSVDFSYRALKKIIDLKGNIIGVCTKNASEFNSDFCDLAPLCISNNIPYRYVSNINSKKTVEWIKSLKPDIIFCFGWSFLLKKKILETAPMGVVGYHPTKLPENRGRHPLIWALILGLEKSASTFFFMEEGADDGDILSQEDFIITYEDDSISLYNKVSNIALRQITDFLPLLKNRSFTKVKQNNVSSNLWRKRGEKDGLIDFRMSSRAIYNLVRALTKPYVGAHIIYNGETIHIWRVKELMLSRENIEPGKILEVNQNSILVKTYDGAIEILDHDFSNSPKVGEYL